MATSWQQLGVAVRARIVSQLTGGSPPSVYLDMAPMDADLPYIVILPVIEEEVQIFDDSSEPTDTDFDISVFSPKIGTVARTTHLNHVGEVTTAIRRWKPTMANWSSDEIRQINQTPMQPLDDALQTVVSFSVVTQRK